MSDEEWYVTNGEWRMGPLTVDDAVEVLGRSHTPGTILVWKEGLETWIRPELVPELTEAPARPATPLVPRGWPTTAGSGPASVAGAPGGADVAAPWFRVGTAKLLLMCVVTFGFYQMYWFYQQWRHVRGRGEAVHPALRTLFAGFFCYALFRRVSADATDRGVPRVPSAIGCAVAFILLSISVQLPAPWSSLSLLSLVPLAMMQRAASAAALAAVPTADPNIHLTPINWLGVAFGVVLLGLVVLVETLAPPTKPEPAKPAPTVVTAQVRAAPQANVN
ncbi:MAG: DUF4339 domain-containing protein [Vicinamibacteraceae bacterium]